MGTSMIELQRKSREPLDFEDITAYTLQFSKVVSLKRLVEEKYGDVRDYV